jgi:threonine dehydrogenase-like Zn-dependent dehydrogenase
MLMPSGERVLVVEHPGRAVLLTDPADPPLPEGAFDVRTVFSGLSAGTELSFFKGTHPHLSSGWDGELGLFGPWQRPAGYPVRRWGYMQVGRVGESRTPAVAPGSLVAMTYGHRGGYRGDPLVDRVVPLPGDLPPLLGIYVAHMGPICANGLLHAAAELHGSDVRELADGVRGRRVAITGSGVVGLVTALFAREHGAEAVVLIEATAARRAVGEALGFPVLDPADDPAVLLKTRWRHGPADRGADVVFQCRGQAASLALALRLLRPQGAVIDLAFYQAGADEVRLGEEFHHNGLAVRSAQIGRVPRGMAHLWGRERLSAETIALLRAVGDSISRHVVTDVLPIEQAPGLLDALARRKRHVLQAVFTFGDDLPATAP